MSEPTLDVVAVGDALVDVLAYEDADFVSGVGLAHGAATMVDADTSDAVYARMNPATEMSGGSAANTAAGVASLGGSAAFVGKVRDDQMGKVFAHDLRAMGVRFDTPPDTTGPPTGRCLVLVTPDHERTMCTYLGAAQHLTPADVDADLFASAAMAYFEGYLWDLPHAKDAIRVAIAAAHDADRRVAFTLSDPFCVERHRDEFVELLDGIDVLFANEVEIRSLFEVDGFDTALHEVRGRCEIAVLTRSAAGSVVATADDVHVVEATPVEHVADVTGAGDLYAAGFLFGLTHGYDLITCGRLGSVAAAEVISHLGARPVTPLAELAAPLTR